MSPSNCMWLSFEFRNTSASKLLKGFKPKTFKNDLVPKRVMRLVTRYCSQTDHRLVNIYLFLLEKEGIFRLQPNQGILKFDVFTQPKIFFIIINTYNNKSMFYAKKIIEASRIVIFFSVSTRLRTWWFGAIWIGSCNWCSNNNVLALFNEKCIPIHQRTIEKKIFQYIMTLAQTMMKFYW